MIHHLSLGAVTIDRAARFYDAVLASLGFVRVWSGLRPGGQSQAVGHGPAGSDDKLEIKQVPQPVAAAPPGLASGEALVFRPARPEDAVECVVLRGQTQENAVSRERLESMGITAQSWAEDIRTGELPGHVCRVQGRMVGYGFGSRSDGEVVVLALLPPFEARGIGKELLRRVCSDLIAQGHERLFLGCSSDPKSRSHGFYRHLGWRSTGAFDARGDEILEYVPRS